MKFEEKISQLRENAEILLKTKSYPYEESLRLSLNIYNIVKDFTKEEFEDLLKTIEEEKVEGIALKNFLIHGCADFDPDITDQEDINRRLNYLDRLIDQDMVSNELYPEGPVSLTLAVKSRSPEIVNLLINTKKANPLGIIDSDISFNENKTAKESAIQILKYIVEAIDFGRLEKELLSSISECYKKNVMDTSGRTDYKAELNNAARTNDTKLIQILLAVGIEVNSENRDEETTLDLAAKNGNLEAVKILIKARAKSNLTIISKVVRKLEWILIYERNSVIDKDGLINRYTEIIEILLKHNPNLQVNPQDLSDYNPLGAAVTCRLYKIAEILVKRGARIDKKEYSSERSPLDLAIEFGNLAILETMLKYGGNYNRNYNFLNQEPFYYAIKSGNPAKVKMLLNTGNIDVNMPYKHDKFKEYGATHPFLYYAIEFGNPPIVEMLLKHGADIHILDSNGNGNTLLHIAAMKGNVEIVEILIARGINVNIKNKNGRTACERVKLMLSELETNTSTNQNCMNVPYSPNDKEILRRDNLKKVIKILEEAESKTSIEEIPTLSSLPRNHYMSGGVKRYSELS